MTITFPDGTRLQAALLMRIADSLKAAVPGEDDPRVFTCISGTWISEDVDPVRIEFEWEKRRTTFTKLDDCICDKGFASRLIARLLSPDDDHLLGEMLFDHPPAGIRSAARCLVH